MDKNTLKLGLVLAGGTSMGVFTGVAITESLKQLLVFGEDENGNSYENIEIDVMTGASAGSVVISLLLRSLIYADDICLLSNKEAEKKLTSQFGSKLFASLTLKRQKELIQIQKAQEIQIEVWTKELSIKNFLADNNGSLNKGASIMNSDILSSIAQKYLFPPKEITPCLLSSRVLIQFTLSRLAAFRHDSRSKFLNQGDESSSLVKALGDGLVSYNHKDSRTFDININSLQEGEEDLIDSTFLKFNCSDKDSKNDLKSSKFWAQTVSTAIASAAFPFALEPTVLMRSREEYGNEWPEELSKFTQYPFTYIDGGVLNNEPIREAFKLAQILDFGQYGFDRKILFIDPNVKEKQGGFNPGIHSQFYFPKHKSKFQELETKNTHQRLASFIWPMINMYEHQSKIIEGDKVLSMKERFKKREIFHRNLISVLPEKSEKKTIISLVKVCEELIETQNSTEFTKITVWQALDRIIKTYKKDFFSKVRSAKALDTFFVELKTDHEITNSKEWYAALWLLYGDFSLGLQKRDERAQLVPIAPYDFTSDKIVRLPGAEVAGFAGFASSAIANFTIEFAKYMTLKFLDKSNCISKDAMVESKKVSILTFDEIKFDLDFQNNMTHFYERVQQIATSNTLPFEIIWKFGHIKSKLVSFLENTENTKGFEFRIEIPNTLAKKLELDGKDFFDTDMKTVIINKKNYLITFATYNYKSQKWDGIHLNKSTKLSIDYDGARSPFCQIQMPDNKQINNIELMPNPFFKIKLSYDDKKKVINRDRWSTNHFGITSLDEKLTNLFNEN